MLTGFRDINRISIAGDAFPYDLLNLLPIINCNGQRYRHAILVMHHMENERTLYQMGE